MMAKSILFNVFILISTIAVCQNGPGGIGNTSGNSELKLWLLGDSGVSVLNGFVNHWTDYSGNQNHVTNSFPSNRPAYFSPGSGSWGQLQFDGFDDFLEMGNTSTDFATKEMTIFIVTSGPKTGSPISITANGISEEFAILNSGIYHHSSSGNFTTKSPDCISIDHQNFPDFTTAIYGETPADLNIRVNGVSNSNSVNTYGSPWNFGIYNRKVKIGARFPTPRPEYFNGKIYEVIVYNKKLPFQDILTVENYLFNKFFSDGTNPCNSWTRTNQGLNPSVKNFPNPTMGKMSITVSNPGLYQIKILDSYGREVLSQNFKGTLFQGNTSELANGLYMVQIHSNGRLIWKERLLKF